MPSVNEVSLILSVLFLVILQLCSFARSIDISSKSKGDVWLIGGGPGIPIGPFSLIHAVNYFTLGYLLVGLTDLYSQNVLVGIWNAEANPLLYLIIIAFGIFILLPILEIQNYGQANSFGVYGIPESFLVHLVGVVSSIFVIWIGSTGRRARPSVDSLWEIFPSIFSTILSNPILLVYDVITLVFGTIWILMGLAFLSTVYSEMSHIDIRHSKE